MARLRRIPARPLYTTFASLLDKQEVGRESASRANGRLMTS
jgi:hypothetical protein